LPLKTKVLQEQTLKKSLFFLLLCFSFYVNSCASSQTEKSFYQGLLVWENSKNREEAIGFFEKALKSSNAYIRQAAAEELAKLMYMSADLPPKTEERIRKEVSGSWAAAFDAVGQAPEKGKVLAFLFSPDYGTAVPNEAMLYTLRECKKQGPLFFTEPEAAAIEGHFAASRSRYNEALKHFNIFKNDAGTEGKWPEQLPAMFVQYPELINDLGKVFQYTSSGGEGIDLFLGWEKAIAEKKPVNKTDDDNDNDLRYRLLFFAARIAKQMNRHEQGILLFQQAKMFAPNGEQADACIWYILDLSLGRSSDECIQRLEQFAAGWHKSSSFDDILEKLSRELTAAGEWKKIIHVFTLIKERGAALSKARYAWIIARVAEESATSDQYLSPDEMRYAASAANIVAAANAASAANAAAAAYAAAAANAADAAFAMIGGSEVAAAFMQIAYDAGCTAVASSRYYRWLSAAALGKPVFVFASVPADASSLAGKPKGKPAPVLEFLLGFFSNNAGQFALRYIRPLEKELNHGELRAVAEALGNAGMYSQSIRLVSLYIDKEGYAPERRDMELLFPRPYNDLIEKYAAEFSVDLPLLLGLIRTESAFMSGVTSHAGAVGLTQLMPATAAETAARIRRSPDHAAKLPADSASAGKTLDKYPLDIKDPEINICIGSYYFNYLMGIFNNDTMLSLMAYNGGMNRVRRWRAASPLPADLLTETVPIYETRDYGRKVMAAAAVYRELYY